VLDIKEYLYLEVNFTAGSVAGKLTFQHSSDGLSWTDGESYDLAASQAKALSVPASQGYIRLKYTNGDSTKTDHKITSAYVRNYA
jgi:hypothetical protein